MHGGNPLALLLKLKAEVVNTPGPQNMDVNVSRSAYNIKVTDFVPFVNAAQPQRAINRQLEY